ncbi:MAG: iron donor protein CyaY [Gammaproteobacteria bacterium]
MDKTMPMDESTYHNLCDELFAGMETLLDDADADYFRSGGVLEIETESGNKIIVSRQTPLREIWVAEKTAGRHFKMQDGEWIDTLSARPLLPYLKSLLAD